MSKVQCPKSKYHRPIEYRDLQIESRSLQETSRNAFYPTQSPTSNERQVQRPRSKVQGPKSKVQSPRFKVRLFRQLSSRVSVLAFRVRALTLDLGPWTLDFGLWTNSPASGPRLNLEQRSFVNVPVRSRPGRSQLQSVLKEIRCTAEQPAAAHSVPSFPRLSFSNQGGAQRQARFCANPAIRPAAIRIRVHPACTRRTL